MEKMLDGFKKKIIPIHTNSPSMLFLIFGSGSFAVQYGDHLLSNFIESAAYGVIFTSCLCQSPNERVRAFDTNNE